MDIRGADRAVGPNAFRVQTRNSSVTAATIDPHASPRPDRAGGSRSQRHLHTGHPHPPAVPTPWGAEGRGPTHGGWGDFLRVASGRHKPGKGSGQVAARATPAGGASASGACSSGLSCGAARWASLHGGCTLPLAATQLQPRAKPSGRRSRAGATGAGALGREAVGFVFKFTTHLFS